VSPFEVESILLEHPAVAEAGVVVGAPDATPECRGRPTSPRSGERRRMPRPRDSILAHARRSMPPYMRVRRVEFAELPKPISGKIRRVELREREQELADARIETEFRESDFPGPASGTDPPRLSAR
jgi:acetyl-CoA synthetase